MDWMQAGHKTLLYYPAFRPPSEGWIRNAILYWDRFATIVPEANQSEVVTGDLAYLEGEGIYRPKEPQQLVRDHGRSIANELAELLEANQPDEGSAPEDFYDVAIGKLDLPILDVFANFGALSGQVRQGWVSVRKDAALTYMSLLAKHVSCSPSYGYDIYDRCTDDPEAEKAAFRSGQEPGLQILLRNALPQPCEDVPLSDLITFRSQRRAELFRFRKFLWQFEDALGSAHTEEQHRDILVRFRNEVETELLEVEKLMKDARFRLRFGSFQSLMRLAPAGVGAIAGVAVGQGTQGSLFGGAAMLCMGGAIEVSQALIASRNYEQMRMNSVLSYVMAARDEGILC